MMVHRHFDGKEKEEPVKKRETYSIDLLNRKIVKGKKRKAVVYAGTRNLYSDMVLAAKSLLNHNPNFKVYFLIEDEKFPYDLPDCIECIDVSKQTWFKSGGLNYWNHWSYMVLLRAAYAKMFPEYDRILSLDVDTIVMEDISPLWDYDMTDYYIAGVPEYMVRHDIEEYINFGVCMYNLDKIRNDGLDDTVIRLLNIMYFKFPEQDAMNKEMLGHVLVIPKRYNDSYCCGTSDDPAIVHLVGAAKSMNPRKHLQDDYVDVPWEEILKKRR